MSEELEELLRIRPE